MKKRDIIVVATSTGGLAALNTLVSAWPADLPASVFVVMHVGAQPSILPEILQRSCALRVQHAENEQEFQDSVVYVAPPDRHLIVQDGKRFLSPVQRKISLVQQPTRCFDRLRSTMVHASSGSSSRVIWMTAQRASRRWMRAAASLQYRTRQSLRRQACR